MLIISAEEAKLMLSKWEYNSKNKPPKIHAMHSAILKQKLMEATGDIEITKDELKAYRLENKFSKSGNKIVEKIKLAKN